MFFTSSRFTKLLKSLQFVAGDAAVIAAKSGPLELKNVNFTYPLRKDRPVLSNLNLTLAKGSVTALVGRRYTFSYGNILGLDQIQPRLLS